jgi:hypothetical protein
MNRDAALAYGGDMNTPEAQAAAGRAIDGLLGGPLAFAPVAMFVGPNSKTWDAVKAAKAAQMEKAGVDARAIWSETGTFKGADGKWRQEIDDSGSMFRGFGATDSQPVGQAIHHPGAMKAYPEMADMRAQSVSGSGGSFTGEMGYAPSSPTVNLGWDNGPGTQSVALHELQHAVQGREGFARGGSPSTVSVNVGSLPDKDIVDAAAMLAENAAKWGISIEDIIAKPPRWMRDGYGDLLTQDATKYLAKTPDALKQAQGKLQESAAAMLNPFETYKRLAGEAEARATQARMNMTQAQRLAKFPFDSYDVPVNSLIVRGQ